MIAVLAASPVAASSTDAEQAQAAERIAARTQDALDGILGPGRSKVQIDVAGEHSETDSDAEFLFPMYKAPKEKSPGDLAPADKGPSAGRAADRILDLPGYSKDGVLEPFAPKAGGLPGFHSVQRDTPSSQREPPAAAPAPEPFQKAHESSRHDEGFKIRSIHATVVLDAALGEALVREVSQLLPQLLSLDTTRGDTLSLLRAPLRPAWKSAFATPSDWRSASYALGAGLFSLLAALIVFAGLVGAGRALGRSLGRELTARGRSEPPASAVSAETLPELLPGAAGFLEAGGPGAEAASPAPLLGRRFDFLIGRDPDLIARAIAAEKPEELSLFFGHLAESIPDLASRLFAHLPSEAQAEVSNSLLKLSVADPDRLTALEDRLRQSIEHGVMGPQSLGRILSRVPGDARAGLLGRLAARDVEEVERHMFSFEDLEGLEAAPLRRLLGAVPYETWGPALRAAPRALVDAVLADLPEGPREMVRSAVDAPQPREKIEEARSKILDAFTALQAKGEMSLGGAEKDEDLV